MEFFKEEFIFRAIDDIKNINDKFYARFVKNRGIATQVKISEVFKNKIFFKLLDFLGGYKHISKKNEIYFKKTNLFYQQLNKKNKKELNKFIEKCDFSPRFFNNLESFLMHVVFALKSEEKIIKENEILLYYQQWLLKKEKDKIGLLLNNGKNSSINKI